jgi:glycosyltransferase involved in cell wall biosynthesis
MAKPMADDLIIPVVKPSFAGKRVLIDGQNLTLARGTGIATYSRQLISDQHLLGLQVDAVIGTRFRLKNNDPAGNRQKIENRYGSNSFLPEKQRNYIRGLLAQPFGGAIAPIDSDPPYPLDSEIGRLSFVNKVFGARDLFDVARQHAIRWGKMLPVSVAGASAPDLFHAPQIAPIRVKNRPNVVTIHDIIPLVLEKSTTENLRHFHSVVKAILRSADHVITVSEHSRRDLIQFLGADEKRVTNTYQTVQLPQFLVERSATEIDSDLDFYGLEQGEYFMYLGAIEPKKNIKRLVQAFAGSRSSRTLVIVGGLGWNYHEDLDEINSDRFHYYKSDGPHFRKDRQVRRLSYVPQAQLISLLRGARGLLFPSLYEGFGLPVAEALALGTPVMTSNTSSLPEIAGDAALQVDPYDVVAMAKAIRALDHDADLRADLSRRGPLQVAQFSAENHRQRLQSVYNQVL